MGEAASKGASDHAFAIVAIVVRDSMAQTRVPFLDGFRDRGGSDTCKRRIRRDSERCFGRGSGILSASDPVGNGREDGIESCGRGKASVGTGGEGEQGRSGEDHLGKEGT